MCTSFVFKGDDVIVGFNFDYREDVPIKVKAKSEFAYGVFKGLGGWIVPFGVSKAGQFGTLLMVPKSPKEVPSPSSQRIDKLVEDYIYGRISLDQAEEICGRSPIVNDTGWSFHAQLSDRDGRSLIIEPGRGHKLREEPYSVLTNFSFFEPFNTKSLPDSGYDRYLVVSQALKEADESFSVEDAMKLLQQVAVKKGEGEYVTRVSFVYSVALNQVFWVMDQQFDNVHSQRY